MVQYAAGLDDIHHEESEGHAQGHIQAEQGEGAGGERAEPTQVAQLRDAEGEGGEDQGHDHEEQEAQEDLTEGIEDAFGDPVHSGPGLGGRHRQSVGGEPDNDAHAKADENPAGLAVAVGSRRRGLGCVGVGNHSR